MASVATGRQGAAAARLLLPLNANPAPLPLNPSRRHHHCRRHLLSCPTPATDSSSPVRDSSIPHYRSFFTLPKTDSGSYNLLSPRFAGRSASLSARPRVPPPGCPLRRRSPPSDPPVRLAASPSSPCARSPGPRWPLRLRRRPPRHAASVLRRARPGARAAPWARSGAGSRQAAGLDPVWGASLPLSPTRRCLGGPGLGGSSSLGVLCVVV